MPSSDISMSPPEEDRSAYLGWPRGRMLRLCLKELRETLRDRRTLVTLILMPLILYPLLSIVFERFLLTSGPTGSAPQILLGVLNESQIPPLQEVLARGLEAQRALPPRAVRDTPEPISGAEDKGEPTLQVKVVPNLAAAVISGEVDVGLQWQENETSEDGQRHPRRIRMTYRKGAVAGKLAAEYLEAKLIALNEADRVRRLRELGDPGGPLIFVEGVPLPSAPSTGVSVAAVIPLILVLMTMTGAVYPAIDLTAGERERGTLEALVAAPVPRFSLLFAKYLAVVVVSVLTATANLLAMYVTLSSTGIGPALFGGQDLSLTVMASTLLLLVLFAFFFSSVLLAATSFARSFKEAQAYLIPLTLASLGPSLCSLVPGVVLSPTMAAIPLVNLVLLARDLFAGSVSPASLGIVLISTVVYSVASVGIAAHYFGSDAVLYRNDVMWSDMFRRPRITRDLPSIGEALMALAIILPVNILLTHLLARIIGTGNPGRLLSGMASITLILFGVVPAFAAWWGRLRSSVTFGLRKPGWRVGLAGLLFGVALTPLLLTMTYWIRLGPLAGGKVLEVQQLVEEFQSVPPWALVLVLAVIPAVCEEWFFRGYLYSALSGESSPAKVVFVSAVLFGMFHVLGGAFAVERFLPSTCIGLVLGWLRLRSGSLFPGILLHAVHNGGIALLTAYEPTLRHQSWVHPSNTQLTVIVILSACLALVAATLTARQRPAPATPILPLEDA